MQFLGNRYRLFLKNEKTGVTSVDFGCLGLRAYLVIVIAVSFVTCYVLRQLNAITALSLWLCYVSLIDVF